MSAAIDNLWRTARAAGQVDAEALAGAVKEALSGDGAFDYRTRLLLRDSVRALESHWGPQRMTWWMRSLPQGDLLSTICESVGSSPAEEGFPSLSRRIVDTTKPETVLSLLRELSLHVRQPTRLLIGGSIALLLGGYLSRHTEDIDIVDEVPANLRAQHELLDDFARRYGLRLAHFQSHFLPREWEQRVHSVGSFEQLKAFVVDVYDVFLGKLFSHREKDRDDLRAVAPQLDRQTLVRRLHQTTATFRSDPRLLDAAQQNWFILFGEPLPA